MDQRGPPAMNASAAASPSGPGGKDDKHPKKRTKTGCQTCRNRRIKCDETKPYCHNCTKSKRICEGTRQSMAEYGMDMLTSHQGMDHRRGVERLLPVVLRKRGLGGLCRMRIPRGGRIRTLSLHRRKRRRRQSVRPQSSSSSKVESSLLSLRPSNHAFPSAEDRISSSQNSPNDQVPFDHLRMILMM